MMSREDDDEHGMKCFRNLEPAFLERLGANLNGRTLSAGCFQHDTRRLHHDAFHYLNMTCLTLKNAIKCQHGVDGSSYIQVMRYAVIEMSLLEWRLL